MSSLLEEIEKEKYLTDRRRSKRQKIVCLCGSVRFADEFKRQELAHLLRGEIAIMPCCMFTDIQRDDGSDYKRRADERHKQLIDLADEVLVLNVGGYVGNSTRGEIKYALAHNKKVKWLNPPIDSDSRNNCEECGWPMEACCCELAPQTEAEWAERLSDSDFADELIAHFWDSVGAKEKKKQALLSQAIDRIRAKTPKRPN